MLTGIIVVSALLQGLIALTVLIKSSRHATNVLFSLLSLSLIVWALVNYIFAINPFSDSALLIIRLVMFSVVIQNVLFLLFASTFPAHQLKFSHRNLVRYLLFSSLVAGLTLTPFVFKEVVYTTQGANPVPSPGIALFVLHAGLSVIAGFVSLVRKYRRSRERLRQQLKYILVGSIVLWIVVPLTNFILTLALQTNIFAKLGPIYTLAFSSIIAYVIARHRFLDIRAIIARTVAYVLLLFTFAAIYSSLVFAISTLLIDTNQLTFELQILYVLLALLTAFTFQPLKRFFDRVTDKIFYQDRYDSQEVLNKLGSILASQIDIDIIIQSSLDLIAGTLKPFHGRLIVMDEGKIYRTAEHGKPPQSFNSKSLELIKSNVLVSDELEEGELKKLYQQHDVAVSLRLKTQEGVVGYLFLGSKQNGSIYIDQDVRLLEILNNELAIAVQNARSFEKIADFNITLQQRIKEATKRLAAQNQRLKELDEAKDEFISMASHQLRTPLTAIKGYLSMLTEGDAGNLSKKQNEFADLAYTSAERMVYLISDMLNVSRINTGKLVLDRAPIDLVKTVEGEIAQLKRTAKARGVDLVYKAEKIPILNLDEGKMRQVIMNFMDNAIYYAPNGKVEIKLEHIGEKIRFTVKDHGIGVPKAAQKNLFGKFFRADNAKKSRPDGTGLGLYMARIVVEMQGGSVIFHSEEGKGSTFGFEFPMSAVKPSAKTPAKEPAAVKS